MDFKLLIIENNVLIYTIFFLYQNQLSEFCASSQKNLFWYGIFDGIRQLQTILSVLIDIEFCSLFPSDKMKQYRIKYQSLESPFDIPFLYHPFHSETSTEHDVCESESNINIYTRIKNKDKHEYANTQLLCIDSYQNFSIFTQKMLIAHIVIVMCILCHSLPTILIQTFYSVSLHIFKE